MNCSAVHSLDVSLIQQGINAVFDQATGPDLRRQAQEYLDNIRQTCSSWPYFIKLLESSDAIANPQLAFFCLLALEEAHRANVVDCNILKSSLLALVTPVFPSSAPYARSTTYCLSKIAQLFVLLIRPNSCEELVNDLLNLVSPVLQPNGNDSLGPDSAFAIDFFLRACLAIDQEIVSPSINRPSALIAMNQEIKDTLRLGSIEKLVSAWYNIAFIFQSINPDITNMAITAIGLYAAWIDITLVANGHWISLIFSLTACSQYRTSCIACLTEIVAKGMAPEEKLHVFAICRVAEFINSISVCVLDSPNDNEDLIEPLGRLINAYGNALACSWYDSTTETVKETIESSIGQIFPIFIKYFTLHQYEHNILVYSFAIEFTKLLKKSQRVREKPLSAWLKSLLESLLQACIQKFTYSNDQKFVFSVFGCSDLKEESEEDDEYSFVSMRRRVKVIYDAIAFIDYINWSSLVENIINDVFNRYSQSPSCTSWNEVELALFLLYLHGETIKIAGISPEAKVIFAYTGVPTSHMSKDGKKITPLGNCLISMLRSGVSSLKNPAISSIFFEVVARYSSFFIDFEEYIPQALQAFVDDRGLRSNQEQIRSRASYLLLRFCKDAHSKLAPIAPQILSYISGWLTVDTKSLDSKIFETVGVLISLEKFGEDERFGLVKEMIQPLAQRLEISAKTLPTHVSDPTSLDPLISQQITVICTVIVALGSIAKEIAHPVGKMTINNQVANLLSNTSLLLVQLLVHLQWSLEVRSTVRAAFKRTIGVSSMEGAIKALSQLVEASLNHGSANEISDLLSILSQALHLFKTGMWNHLAKYICRILTIVFGLLQNTMLPDPEEQKSIRELKYAYLNFLNVLLNAKTENVFFDPNVAPEMISMVLHSLIALFRESGERQQQRQAIGIMTKFVQAWYNNGEINKIGSSSFDKLLHPMVAEMCIQIPAQNFELEDAGTSVILFDIANLHRALCCKPDSKWPGFLETEYLPMLNLPPESAFEFVMAVKTLEPPAMRDYIHRFFRGLRR